MQRKPSHLGSYCQPGPSGSSAASSASIGASVSTRLSICRQSPAACSRSRCVARARRYAAHAKGRNCMAFEVQAATARYIDSLGPAALQKAHDYTVGKEWMLPWGLLVAAVVTWLIVRSGVLDRLEVKIGERRRNLNAFVLSLVFLVVSTVLTLPWTLYEAYFRERSYGRTSQPIGDFLGQLALASTISIVITALFLMGVYWLMRRS